MDRQVALLEQTLIHRNISRLINDFTAAPRDTQHLLLESKYEDTEPGLVEDYESPLSAVRSVVAKVERELNNQGYLGKFRGAGSAFDGTSTGNTSDFDFVYEFCNLDLNRDEYTVLEKNREPEVLILRRTASGQVANFDCCDCLGDFKKRIEEAAEHIDELKIGIAHAGCTAPYFGGARKHASAVTLQFEFSPRRHAPYLVTIDLILAIRAPDDTSKDLVREVVNPVACRVYEEPAGHHIHLIPYHKGGDTYGWYYTTCILEKYLVRSINDASAIKRTLRLCKAIAKRYFSYEATPDTFKRIPGLAPSARVAQSLEQNRTYDNNRAVRLYDDHIYLPLYKGQVWKETTKPTITINSGALKYLVLKLAFEGDIPNTSDWDLRRYVKLVFSTILTTPDLRHPFVGTDIQPIKVAAYIAEEHTQGLVTLLKRDVNRFCESLP